MILAGLSFIVLVALYW